MSWILYDPDEWVTRSKSTPTSVAVWQERRSPEKIRQIKIEKQRQHEDAVLAEAEVIKARRERAI